VASADAAQTHPRHAWLAVALPASAARVRAADPALARTLAQAGAELGDEGPDVEIGPLRALRGEADWAVVPLDAGPPRGASLVLRSARRIVDSVAVRRRATSAARTLRRRGYTETAVLVWDLQQPLRAPGLERRRYRTGPASLVPLGAAARGARKGGATLYQAVRSEAEREGGTRLDPGAPMVREGVLVSLSPAAVLRVALGAGRDPLLRQRAALEALRAGTLPAEIEARVPWPLAHGRTGLADWAVERRLSGETVPAAVEGRLLDDCVDFLVALFAAGDGAAPASPAADAETIARHCSPGAAERVRELGRRLEQELAGVRRGFAHGDFSTTNLIVEQGRLSGVIDWERAGAGRLPLLDLFKLLLEAERLERRTTFGDSLVRFLLPWARTGGDDTARAYCNRIGLAADSRLLERLVAAFWLDRFAYELGTVADRSGRADWMRANIYDVADALAIS
jgi:aminoglycoside phosphotransferase (APT) family kinase protein